MTEDLNQSENRLPYVSFGRSLRSPSTATQSEPASFSSFIGERISFKNSCLAVYSDSNYLLKLERRSGHKGSRWLYIRSYVYIIQYLNCRLPNLGSLWKLQCLQFGFPNGIQAATFEVAQNNFRFLCFLEHIFNRLTLTLCQAPVLQGSLQMFFCLTSSDLPLFHWTSFWTPEIDGICAEFVLL